MLHKLEREEESSMDEEACPELKALLTNVTPLSRLFQTMELAVERR